ncbi:triose-phosphate isomerase [Halobellus rarus]|uniref:Triose-phosphate isomerase n=1 Tax=Halobellus rarus TaxID=1126237 RepID=A0ABD6CPM5_9EURY|nr:triose-phosphate isomerase [Halobellus rarus]
MALEYPTFLINFKRYEGTAGGDGLELAKTIETVQERTDTSLAVAPQTPDLSRIASEADLRVVAQSVDAAEPGRGTGEIGLPAVDAAGADGVLVNHPESPQTLADVEAIVGGCRERGLESIVCVDSVEMGRGALAFDPDCLLFENPDDIATGRSLAETAPERVETFVSMVREENVRTRLLLGGGITTGVDVEASLRLGADGAGAASAFVNAADGEAWLADIAESLADSSVQD